MSGGSFSVDNVGRIEVKRVTLWLRNFYVKSIIMNPYIDKHIIKPIDLYLNDNGRPEIEPWKIEFNAKEAKDRFGLFNELREAMKPYYKMLLMADDRFGRNKETVKIKDIVQGLFFKDSIIGRHMNDVKIVECAEACVKRLVSDTKPPYMFMCLLKHLIQTGYDPGWDLVETDVRKRLSRAPMFGDHKQLEMYCIVMAFRLVMKSDLSDKEKGDKYDEIRCKWEFLRYMFSVMIGVIVGLRSENFASLASSLTKRKSDYGYMHLAYKAFMDNFDKLCPPDLIDAHTNKLVRDQARTHMRSMEIIIKSTVPDDSLTPLCEILFPKKMKAVLAHERPKTYEELERDVQSLTQSYNDFVNRMAQSVRDAISIESLTEAFLRFPPELGMSMYQSVNNLLAQDPVWQRYQSEIQKKILAKFENKGEPQINNIFNSGSVTMNAGSSINGDIYN